MVVPSMTSYSPPPGVKVASAEAAVKSAVEVTKGVALTVTLSTSERTELSSAELVAAEARWYSMSSGEAMEVATSGKEDASAAAAASVEFKGSNSGEGEERDSPVLWAGGGGGACLRSSVPLPLRRS